MLRINHMNAGPVYGYTLVFSVCLAAYSHFALGIAGRGLISFSGNDAGL